MSQQLEEIISNFLGQLRGANLISGPVQEPSVPFVRTVTFEPSGWSFDGVSKFGAPMSKRVEDLRSELRLGGYTKLADLLPRYHCIAYWLKQPIPETINVNLNKLRNVLSDFGSFAPLIEDANEDCLVDNIVSAMQLRLTFWLRDPGTDPAKTEYRGQRGRSGFTKVGPNDQPDFSPSLSGPNYRHLLDAGEIYLPGEISFQQYERTYDSWSAEYKTEAVRNTVEPDHYVYTAWWAGVTDEDVGRFWRNWAVSYGAKINLEP